MPSILYIRLQFYRERLLIMPYYHSSRDYQFTRLDYVSAALVCYEQEKIMKKTQNAATEKNTTKTPRAFSSVHFTLLLLLLNKHTKNYYFVIQSVSLSPTSFFDVDVISWKKGFIYLIKCSKLWVFEAAFKQIFDKNISKEFNLLQIRDQVIALI